MRPFDLAVVTARDEAQRQLFEWRLGAMDLTAWTRDVMVVADPPGPQPGSGGSTLYALAAALDRLQISLRRGDDPAAGFGGTRIVLIHCGGLSQRLPQFAALGKAFAPIEPGPDGRTVVEAVLESLAVLAEPMPGGAMVACGDVVYRGSPPDEFPEKLPAVWAWPAPLQQAARHGVFLWDEASGAATRTLQKPPVERLQELGFCDTAPLDAGVLYLPVPVLSRVFAGFEEDGEAALESRVLAGRVRWQGLDLYGQLIPAFVKGCSADGDPLLAEIAGCGLRVYCPVDGKFLHFGTTAELLAILNRGEEREAVLINSEVEGPAWKGGSGCVLAHCRVRAPLRMGANAFLLGLDLRHGGVSVVSNRLLFALPVRGAGGPERNVAVGLGIEDDPKGGSTTLLMGNPLLEWAAERGLTTEDLWEVGTPPGELTLWNARLFPMGSELDLDERLYWLQSVERARAGAAGWPRLSLGEIQQRFDGAQWWRFESQLRRQRAAKRET